MFNPVPPSGREPESNPESNADPANPFAMPPRRRPWRALYRLQLVCRFMQIMHFVVGGLVLWWAIDAFDRASFVPHVFDEWQRNVLQHQNGPTKLWIFCITALGLVQVFLGVLFWRGVAAMVDLGLQINSRVGQIRRRLGRRRRPESRNRWEL